MGLFLRIQLIFVVSFLSVTSFADCLMCRWPLVPEMSQEGPENVCEDLFGAACLKPNGERKFSNVEKNLEQEANAVIQTARAEALRAMGYNSANDAVIGELRRAGIEVEPAAYVSSSNVGAMNFDPFSTSGRSFLMERGCNEDLRTLKSQLPQGSTEEALAQRVQMYLNFEKKKQEGLAKIYALDIPNYMGQADRYCKNFQYDSTSTPPEDNAASASFCSNILQMQREAVDLFRHQGSAQYPTLAEQFVRKYTIPITENVPVKPNKDIASYLRRREAALSSKVNCADVSPAVYAGSNAVLNGLNEKLMRSQPAVEAILRMTYSPERKRALETMTASVRANSETLARGFGPNPAVQEKMASDFARLQVWWPQGFANDDYVKDPQTGLMVLNPDKLDMTEAGIFLDPSMQYFKTFNAYNSPEYHIEETRVANEVNMQPYMLQLMHKSPFYVYAVLAHEFGHNFDPNRVQFSGYQGMDAQYSNLMACYKDSRSINMQRGQEGEVFSDYVAAEMIASEVNKLPPSMRRRAAISSIAGFCMMESLSGNEIQFGEHPITMLRISGVMGANPSLRKMLGCTGDSSKYKSCGMPTSILDMSTQNPAAPSPQDERDSHSVEM